MGVFHDAERSGDDSDTIYALSSGAPPAGLAVVRVSGPRADAALAAIAGELPPLRRAALRVLTDPASGERIDEALVLRFAAGASATGEPVAEFHVHGGRAVVQALFSALDAVEGLRPAGRGEFTRRAFLSGRLDLTEAEGIADLVAAETDAQRRFALGQMSGSIRTQYESWRDRVVRARGLIEAELDFSEEEGIAGAWSAMAKADIQVVAAEMRAAMADLGRADRIRDGAEVVILGAVNAGKSSLINALARRDVAIVSPEAGTTRDLVEAVLDLAGYRVTLVDTAGLREGAGGVEREGIRRARARGDGADLVLWLADRGAERGDGVVAAGVPVWAVATKADLLDDHGRRKLQAADHVISTATGEGIDGLLDALARFLDATLRSAEPPLVARARHRSALAEAVAALDKAVVAHAPELAAESLRVAADRIGSVTGRVGVEDVLDVVFREFCVGK
ncbi:MAG: tRNA uridine-5-carboxymethylaminomethyl(34) synthesis GTPase MnmE [Bauldia sp.]|nr:tRNA uridine-5-carboxymethylaminomethyl(34) synthesis GTPase MnmE [Bauldia sp.]